MNHPGRHPACLAKVRSLSQARVDRITDATPGPPNDGSTAPGVRVRRSLVSLRGEVTDEVVGDHHDRSSSEAHRRTSRWHAFEAIGK
jgi:hypothetical protein